MDSRDSDADDTAGTGHCPLRLYTLAGKEIETIVPISIYHHWEMLEDYLVELLARSFDLDTFGCELMLIAEDTRSPLSDPIHEELWENKGFQLVIHKSFRQVRSKEQIRRDDYEDHPKAIWVPANESGSLPAKAFFALARLRRVQVEVGYHTRALLANLRTVSSTLSPSFARPASGHPPRLRSLLGRAGVSISQQPASDLSPAGQR